MLMKSKKGEALPMNVIIIAIIVLIVLIVVIAFFAGGFGQLGQKLSELFGGQYSGKSSDLAVQDCQQSCDSARDKPADVQRLSSYCKSVLTVDTDGNPSTPPAKVRCSGIVDDIQLTESETKRGLRTDSSWQVSCPEVQPNCL